MSRSTKFHSVISIVIVTGLLAVKAGADQGMDIQYAEQMPLATSSMLLDITRSVDKLVAVGERGHVVMSTDGETWTQAEHVPTRSTLTSVFAIGDRLWAGGHDAVILTSGDGGNTWTRQFFGPDRQQAVMDIYFADEHNGVVIGSYGLYLRTHDGGHSWQQAMVDEDNDYHLNKLLSFGDGKLMIAGEAGYSYRSYDNGETWEALELPYQGSMWGALKTNAECALFYGLRGHIMESCDFGTSWSELETKSESSISDAAQYGDLVLLAANSGTLLIRDEHGGFKNYHHSSGVDFAAVISEGNGKFLLVGEDGVHAYPEAGGGRDGDD